MTQSMKTRISQALMARVAALTDIKSVDFDRVRLRSDDFMGVDCPAVQLIDVAETIAHEHGRAKKTWLLSLELIMKSTDENPVSQTKLWDTQHALERMIWEIPNLAIPGVIHLRYNGSQTDLHLLEPYYYTRLDIECLYYEPLVDNT